jgi:hypothetical protein
MIINAKLISSLNACKDRYDNYVLHYGTTDFDVDLFLDLDKITYNDKLWVLRRVMNAAQARTFAILCADSVVPIYECQYPNDNRVRNCLNFLKSIKDLVNLTDKDKDELKAHRDAASAAYAASAADADAASAADAAAYAAYAASAADADAAAYDAADAAASAASAAYAASAADAKIHQQELNLEYLKQAMSV